MPRPTCAPRRVLACLLATVTLAGCFTGSRPSFSEEAGAIGVETGDASADAVLQRLDAVAASTFTAGYTVLTKFGEATAEATVVQAGPTRRSITIGDVRFIIEGSSTATCTPTTGECSDTIDDNRVSDLQLTHQFYAANMAARLRLDAGRRVGPTTGSTAEIAGQQATCVDVPVSDGTKSYCALDSGTLARYEGADLSIELVSYSPDPDESKFNRRDG